MALSEGTSYFLQAREGGLIKIGGTTVGDDRPRSQLFSGGRELVLLATSDRTEADVQSMFCEYRVRGDWFRAAPALLDFIRVGTRQTHEQRDDFFKINFRSKNHGRAPRRDPVELFVGLCDLSLFTQDEFFEESRRKGNRWVDWPQECLIRTTEDFGECTCESCLCDWCIDVISECDSIESVAVNFEDRKIVCELKPCTSGRREDELRLLSKIALDLDYWWVYLGFLVSPSHLLSRFCGVVSGALDGVIHSIPLGEGVCAYLVDGAVMHWFFTRHDTELARAISCDLYGAGDHAGRSE